MLNVSCFAKVMSIICLRVTIIVCSVVCRPMHCTTLYIHVSSYTSVSVRVWCAVTGKHLVCRQVHRRVPGRGDQWGWVQAQNDERVFPGASPLLPQPGQWHGHWQLPHGQCLSLCQPLVSTQLWDAEMVSHCLSAGSPCSRQHRGEGWGKCTDRDQFWQQRTIQKASCLGKADAFWGNLTVVARLLVCEDG